MEYENNSSAYHLEELTNSDYEIKDGEPDIIGWNVYNPAGGKLGEVDELIFDPQALKVRYIVLNMEGNNQDLEDERRVLIPIGLAELHTATDDVVIPTISVTQLSGLPPYEGCPEITPALEMDIRNVFEGGKGVVLYEHPKFYDHPHFNDDKFYSRNTLVDNETIIPADKMTPEEDIDPTLGAARIRSKKKSSDSSSL